MKKYVLTIIITAIIFTGVGVLATTAITADQVSYNSNTTVKDKIDDLYTISTNYKKLDTTTTAKATDIISGKTAYDSDGNLINGTSSIYLNVTSMNYTTTLRNSGGINFVGSCDKYKYFKIVNIVPNSYATCNLIGWSSTQNASLALQLNTQYEVLSKTDGYEYSAFFINTKSSTDGKQGRCDAAVLCYN